MAARSPTIVAALGAYGRFLGALEDEVVFGAYRREGCWSPTVLDLITKLLARGGTLIDGGANIGLISIPVAARTPCTCFAVEPEPLNFELLSRNVESHGLGERIECLNAALYSQATDVPLRRSADNFGDHRVQRADGADSADVWVRAERLDRLLANRALEPPIVLKLDTQGCEARALEGAADLLPRVDYLLCEYWPAGLLRQGDSVAALEQLLRAFPYATVLGPTPPRPPLDSVDATLSSLSWVPRDGSDEGFFDLLLSRTAEL